MDTLLQRARVSWATRPTQAEDFLLDAEGILEDLWGMKTLKLLCVVVAVCFALPAAAHLKVGTYSGRDSVTGEACSVAVRAIEFEGGLRHPLNERITVLAKGRTWVLRHPAQIDVSLGKVEFSGASLEATQGVPGAGDGFVLTMSHEEGKEGPQDFFLIHHDYRDVSKSTRSACVGLSFQE